MSQFIIRKADGDDVEADTLVVQDDGSVLVMNREDTFEGELESGDSIIAGRPAGDEADG